eukprot:PRCOL_00004428-RA
MVTCNPLQGTRDCCGGGPGLFTAIRERPAAFVAAFFAWVAWGLILTSSFLTFWSVSSAELIIGPPDDAMGLWTFCASEPAINGGCFGYGGIDEPSTLIAARAFVVIYVVLGIWAALAALWVLFDYDGSNSCGSDTNSDTSWIDFLYPFRILGPLGYSTSFYFAITSTVLNGVAAILIAFDGWGVARTKYLTCTFCLGGAEGATGQSTAAGAV